MKPLDSLNQLFVERASEVEGWIAEKCSGVSVPLYTSVDLRVAQFKIAPVDTNIFPAGFNNLSLDCRERAALLFREYFVKRYPGLERILIVPELHTKNPYYWENIHALQTILLRAGYRVEVGLIIEELARDGVEFSKAGGGSVTAYRLMRRGDKVVTSHFEPDLILLNNDFSSKCPEILRGISQPVDPPFEMGWHTRRKDVHFEFYNLLVEELACLLGIDPWRLSMPTVLVRGVSFDNTADRHRVADVVDELLAKTRLEYARRGISDKPYVVIKSNAGTYGMAVIAVDDADTVRSLNVEGRKKMRVSKGGVPVREVVVQEGVPTSIRVEGEVSAEPVVYLVEASLAGGFLRINRGRGPRDNLNTKGMEFLPIECMHGDEGMAFFPYAAQVVSRVATIAAGFEIEKILREGGCKERAY
ncbi:MAG: glutamate--cysteine ligase [Candidatus Methanosuratincola sp.]|jgi:glutamate--cysteine ligase